MGLDSLCIQLVHEDLFTVTATHEVQVHRVKQTMAFFPADIGERMQTMAVMMSRNVFCENKTTRKQQEPQSQSLS